MAIFCGWVTFNRGTPAIGWMACCFLAFASLCFFSSVSQATPTLTFQSDNEIFEQVEPGVRLLGKPDPSAVLGAVLAFHAISETDKIIAVCSDGLKLWDTKQQAILKSLEFERPITTCYSMAVSHDEQTIAISTWSHSVMDANQPGIVLLVDSELNKRAEFVVDENRSSPNSNAVFAISFSADDSKIALASSQVVFWCDIASGEFVETFELGESKAVSQLIIQRDRILGLGWQSWQIDRNDGTTSPLPKTMAELAQVWTLCVDEKANRIFVLAKKKITVTDLLNGSNEEIELEENIGTPFNIALSPDGSLLAVVSFQRSGKTGMQISVFDTRTRSLKHRFDGLAARPVEVQFSVANDALIVAFGFYAGLHRLEFDAQRENQNATIKLNQPVRVVLLSEDGTKLAGSRSTKGFVCDWSTGEESQPGLINVFFPTHLENAFFTMKQQGLQFLIMKNDWEQLTPIKIQTYSMRQPVLPILGNLLGVSERSEPCIVLPSSLAVNDANTELYCIVLDMLDGIRIQTIDLSNNKRTRNVLFNRPRNSIQGMFSASAIANDGKRFAIVESGQLKLIDVESEQTIFQQPVKDAVGLVFSQERDWLAMTTKQGVTILDPDTGDILKKIEEPNALVAYAFGANQMLVASPKKGGQVRIFDTTTWRTTLGHKTETSNRVGATISNDGRRVAFALDNCRLELWDVDELKR